MNVAQTSKLLRICLVVLLTGCSAGTTDSKPGAQETTQSGNEHEHQHQSHREGHTHYGAGPHGGTILELGGDDFHAELTINHDDHAIRIFLLKSDAKTPLPTKATEVILSIDGGVRKQLPARPLESETGGESSRFELIDPAFFHEVLNQGFLHGDLFVEIDSKKFTSHLDIHFEHGADRPDHSHEK